MSSRPTLQLNVNVALQALQKVQLDKNALEAENRLLKEERDEAKAREALAKRVQKRSKKSKGQILLRDKTTLSFQQN